LINLGGYSANQFGELHRYHLVVATNTTQAKQIAKQLIPPELVKPLSDGFIEVDDCIPIDHVAGRFVHLVKRLFKPKTWQNTYLPID
jgi:hypothetical protein